MSREVVSQYCVQCLRANALGEESCIFCGTLLILSPEPRASRFEQDPLLAVYEEHLLERISALEHRVEALSKRVDSSVGFLLDPYLHQTECPSAARPPGTSASRDRRLKRISKETARRASKKKRPALKSALDRGLDGLSSGSFDSATKAFTEANELFPEDNVCRNLLCVTLMEAGNDPRAFLVLNSHAFRSDVDIAGKLVLAFLHDVRENITEAERVLGEVPENDRASFTLSYLSARGAARAGNLSIARRHLSRARKMGPRWICDLALAEINFAGSRFELSETYLDRAIRYRVDSPFVWALKGLLCQNRGDIEAAEFNFTRSRKAGNPVLSPVEFRALKVFTLCPLAMPPAGTPVAGANLVLALRAAIIDEIIDFIIEDSASL